MNSINNTTTILNNWIPISNHIYQNFYNNYNSSTIAVLFKIIARIHNFKGKTYTKFANIIDTCFYFGLSKTPLIRELDILKSKNLIEYKYNRYGHVEIELKLERPSKDFTKVPINLINEAQKLKFTANSFSLYMYIIYKFCRPYEKKEQLSYYLKYFAKVIKTSTKTVKNSLKNLADSGFISCKFAKFQTNDQCIIKPLFLDCKTKPVIIQSKLNSNVSQPILIPVPSKTTKTKVIVDNKINAISSKDKTLYDLKRVLKRHQRNQEDAPLIIKFINETGGLNGQPIKSIPAAWEKDLQSKLKILNFRFVEWKHQQIKKEQTQYFEKEFAKENNAAVKIDRSKVKFDINKNTENTINNADVKMNKFSNQMNKFSNQMSEFGPKMNKFSNNIRVRNVKDLNNHIKGEEPTYKPVQIQNNIKSGILNNDCDSFNFSEEELEAITQYKKSTYSLRILKLEEFIKRYLPIGIELIKSGKELNIENIFMLYAEKLTSGRIQQGITGK